MPFSTKSLPYAAVLNLCPMALDVAGCDLQRLAPLGGSLSELLEREEAACRGRGVLVGVQRGLLSPEEVRAEEFIQVGYRTNGSVVRW